MIKSFITCVMAILTMFLMQGCAVVAFSLVGAIESTTYDKDVSNDPRFREMVGKQYILLQDCYLYERGNYNGSQFSLYLSTLVHEHGNRSVEIDENKCFVLRLVPKGTIFTVTKTTVESWCLWESNRIPNIEAEYINVQGYKLTVNLTNLFRRNETISHNKIEFIDWIPLPQSDLLEEVNGEIQSQDLR